MLSVPIAISTCHECKRCPNNVPRCLTMSRPKRKQRGSSACAFTQALGGEILRQAREMDQLRPDAIFGVYILGSLNRPQPHQSRRTVVRIFRERRTGGSPCFVVETPRAQTRFANPRQAVEAFTFSVEFAIRKICTREERNKVRKQIIHMFDPSSEDMYEVIPSDVFFLDFSPHQLPPFSQHVDAFAAQERFVQRMTALLESPPRVTMKPDYDPRSPDHVVENSVIDGDIEI